MNIRFLIAVGTERRSVIILLVVVGVRAGPVGGCALADRDPGGKERLLAVNRNLHAQEPAVALCRVA
jgi:hypothetical protein